MAAQVQFHQLHESALLSFTKNLRVTYISGGKSWLTVVHEYTRLSLKSRVTYKLFAALILAVAELELQSKNGTVGEYLVSDEMKSVEQMMSPSFV